MLETHLHIDTRRHVRFSSSTERTLQTLLLRDFPHEEAEQLWQRLCRIYESYLTDLPYTGGKSNPMWDDLYDSLAVFAYYEVLPEKPTLEEFEQVVAQNFNRVHFPSWLRFGTGTIRFCVRLIGSVMGRNLNRHYADGSWGNCWGIGTPENLDNLPGMQLRGCPIAAFARKHGYAHLMPAMCNPDFEGMANMHIHLVRPRTVAMGYPSCDYYFTPLGSPEAERYPIRKTPEGFLVNGDGKD